MNWFYGKLINFITDEFLLWPEWCECELMAAPFSHNIFEFGINVSLLNGTDTHILAPRGFS